MVTLQPMEEEDFQGYLKRSIPKYAEAHVTAGNWLPDEALEKSENEFKQLLPQGLNTENQYLYTLYDESNGERVGILWVAVQAKRAVPRAYIYDIEIEASQRRKGYGAQALEAIEIRMRELGVKEIGLNVFGYNQPARALYEKAGYEVMAQYMLKRIERVVDLTL